jgi:hypothetical protein
VFGTTDLCRERNKGERDREEMGNSPVWHIKEREKREPKSVGPTAFLFLPSCAKKGKREEIYFAFSKYTLYSHEAWQAANLYP